MAHHVHDVRRSSTALASAFFFLFSSCFLLVLHTTKGIKINTLRGYRWNFFLLRSKFFLYMVKFFSVVVEISSREVERISHALLLDIASTALLVWEKQ